MIPYFEVVSFSLGPVKVYTWGLMVAAGLLTAVFLARAMARKRGLDPDIILDLSVWIMVGALVMGRLFYVIAYDGGEAFQDPFQVLRVWEGGMSSFGGYIGAAVGTWIFARRRRISLRRYAEIGAFVLPLGYGIGRIGCFLIHDHPGILTGFPLAVAYPEGARLDHGLLLSLVGFVIFAAFLLMSRRGIEVGADRWTYLPALLISYGSIRFGLDFLRAWDIARPDARYLHLTPAQYGAIVLVAGGIYLYLKEKKGRKVTGV